MVFQQNYTLFLGSKSGQQKIDKRLSNKMLRKLSFSKQMKPCVDGEQKKKKTSMFRQVLV